MASKCGVWARGLEQFEDLELPIEVREICDVKIPRRRQGVSLPGVCSERAVTACMSAWANLLSRRHRRLTGWRRALATLQSIQRLACDQHDHVSFAKAWMQMSRGVAHALDYDYRLVPPAVMAPLRRRLEGGLDRRSQCSLEVLSLSWPGSVQTPHVLWWSGHQGCSNGLRGAGNVLVGC